MSDGRKGTKRPEPGELADLGRCFRGHGDGNPIPALPYRKKTQDAPGKRTIPIARSALGTRCFTRPTSGSGGGGVSILSDRAVFVFVFVFVRGRLVPRTRTGGTPPEGARSRYRETGDKDARRRGRTRRVPVPEG